MPASDPLAFATDGFVVEPLFLPGGDIGTLADKGTLDDPAVGGARPLWLSAPLSSRRGGGRDAAPDRRIDACGGGRGRG